MMKKRDQLQTMAVSYTEICQGEDPWVALGNFMNDWFRYAKDRREALVADPLVEPASPTDETRRWMAYCAASVEWFCLRYHVPCPAWVQDHTYRLPEPWFDAIGDHKQSVRERLLKTTPEPFARRNIYSGDDMFANKYEFMEQFQRHMAENPHLQHSKTTVP